MKISALAAAAAVSLLLAGVPAAAGTLQYTATLSGLTEVTPNASPGTGTALITIDDQAMTLRVQASFSGLLGTVTNAHIHCCTTEPGTGPAGVASPVPTFPDFPAGVTEGSYDELFILTEASSWNPAFVTASGGTVDTAFLALLAGLDTQRAYLNIHTIAFPGGEINGFAAPVPEPGTVALVIAGLAVAATRRGRRQAAGTA